jgi:DNA-binding winged helix-turn-helix (wHTH) protein/TolB-like protein/Tfp pilus assembly protein PilF
MSVIEPRTFPSYAFGPFVLDGAERLLWRGDEVVALTPKVFETLFVLVENHGRVVTKNVLMETLWPDVFVEESSLTQNISLLRKALGNGQADQVYVETIPKRGYRFVAPVTEVKSECPTNFSLSSDLGKTSSSDLDETSVDVDETLSSDPDKTLPSDFDKLKLVGHRRWLRWQSLAVLFCVVAVSVGALFWWRTRTAARHPGFALKSVAVLPFKTVGGDGDTELLALGMANSVILKLTHVDQLTVLPTSSVFKYIGGERDALAIGKKLGVDAVLDGTVQRSGDQVRVTAQLINLKDGKTIWSGQFDEQYRSIFCLQDSVSELLAGDLRLQVLSLRAKSDSKPITRDAEAYQAYLKGLYFWNQRSKETLPKAIEHLQQAVDKDENFAVAHALLADCYHISPGILRSNPDEAAAARQKAETAALRAIALDETLAEAHTVMAGILANRGDGDGASKEYRQALLLNPGYATAHVRYAHFLFARLDLEGAVRETRQAQALDPMSPVTNAALGYMLMMDREWEGSIQYLQRSLELNPDATQSRISLGLAYLHCGRNDEAVAEFSKVAEQDPVSSQMSLALTYAKLGRRDEAHKLVAEVLRSAHREQASNYDLVTIYFALGEKERGFALLRKSTLSWHEKALLKLDPEMDDVRSEPRFEAIVNKQFYPEQRS